MSSKEHTTFQQILQQEQPRIARGLEIRARTASMVAKVQPQCALTLYRVKCRAVRQLCSMPGYRPLLRDAWTTDYGILLSIKLGCTNSWLHFPFEQLPPAAQRFYGPWVRRRASGNPWQPRNVMQPFRTRRFQ
jgi:hypothetical protein